MMKAIVPVVLISVIFFVAFYFLGGITREPLIRAIDNAGIILGYLVSCLTAAVGLYAWYKRENVRRWFSRARFYGTGEEFVVPVGEVEAMVIPVSRREQPEWIIRHLRPQKVALLYTRESRSVAVELVKHYGGECRFFPPVDEIERETDMIGLPDDPGETKKIAKKHIRSLINDETDRSRVFVDTTGGKVPMSIGAFQAAEEEGVSSIYVVGKGRKGHITDPGRLEEGEPIFISDRRDMSGDSG